MARTVGTEYVYSLYPTSFTGAPLGTMPAIASLAGLPVISAGVSGPSSVLLSWAGRTSTPSLDSAASAATSASAAAANSLLTNLLPFSTQKQLTLSVGVYVGEGLPPVPSKLAEKISRWEFVEMSEMLPEFWTQLKPTEGEGKPAQARRRRQVTEMFTWVQCFCTYVSVLSGKHPEVVPELMAYLITITRVSQDFAGLAWVRYDAAFRRQAAITGNRRWSQVNPSLYSICFTGRAQQASRCELCFSSSHSTKECALIADTDPELPSRIKAVEAAVVSLAARQSENKSPSSSTQICRLWNANRCRFPRCRYRHVCSSCGETHPFVSCPRNDRKREDAPPPGRMPTRKELGRSY